MDKRNRPVHYLIPCPRTRLGSTAPSLKTFMNTYAAQLQPQKRQISSTESPPEEPKRRKTRSSKKIQDDSTTSKAASPIPQTQVEILETEDAVQKAKGNSVESPGIDLLANQAINLSSQSQSEDMAPENIDPPPFSDHVAYHEPSPQEGCEASSANPYEKAPSPSLPDYGIDISKYFDEKEVSSLLMAKDNLVASSLNQLRDIFASSPKHGRFGPKFSGYQPNYWRS
ncbi:uncharacterized protein LOC120641116 [Panicum virgatum]|uniref:uncharacterized protein LOC120641116 n=1 Tax=Panicum virgatum TaxID=38727 RepID=UPI0019D5BB0B|nr:uncharacterized protein LOC120641116 [Panicum virgatum]